MSTAKTTIVRPTKNRSHTVTPRDVPLVMHARTCAGLGESHDKPSDPAISTASLWFSLLCLPSALM